MMDQAAFDRPTGMKRLLQCVEDEAAEAVPIDRVGNVEGLTSHKEVLT
jgi:hypothetical protein